MHHTRTAVYTYKYLYMVRIFFLDVPFGHDDDIVTAVFSNRIIHCDGLQIKTIESIVILRLQINE